jgi:hypothetical protein
MVRFVTAIIHEGNQRFSVNKFTGKQCVFITFSSVLTAENYPLT